MEHWLHRRRDSKVYPLPRGISVVLLVRRTLSGRNVARLSTSCWVRRRAVLEFVRQSFQVRFVPAIFSQSSETYRACCKIAFVSNWLSFFNIAKRSAGTIDRQEESLFASCLCLLPFTRGGGSSVQNLGHFNEVELSKNHRLQMQTCTNAAATQFPFQLLLSPYTSDRFHLVSLSLLDVTALVY